MKSLEGTAGDAVVDYYDRTWFDYRFVWLNRRNLAVHFGYYDAMYRSHARALENMNRVLADRVGIGSTDRVLDAGCGVGGSSIWLAEQRGARVIGITPVASQIARGRRAVAARGVADRVDLLRGDFANVPFPDASFDVVWALESLCHATSKPSVYREFFRVLKPGGRLVIAEYMRRGRPLANEQERLLADWLAGWAIPDIDSANEHEQAARDAGFACIDLRDVTAQVRPSLRRLFALTYLGIPIDRLLARCGLRGPAANGNVTGARRQYQALRTDAWFYAIKTACRPAC